MINLLETFALLKLDAGNHLSQELRQIADTLSMQVGAGYYDGCRADAREELADLASRLEDLSRQADHVPPPHIAAPPVPGKRGWWR